MIINLDLSVDYRRSEYLIICHNPSRFTLWGKNEHLAELVLVRENEIWKCHKWFHRYGTLCDDMEGSSKWCPIWWRCCVNKFSLRWEIGGNWILLYYLMWNGASRWSYPKFFAIGNKGLLWQVILIDGVWKKIMM